MSKFIETLPSMTAEVVSSKGASIAEITLVLDDHVFTWTGTAKREPGDRFSKEIGERLALARAFDSARKQLSRGAEGMMKSAEDNKAQSKIAKSRPRPEGYAVKGKSKKRNRRNSLPQRRKHVLSVGA